VKKKIFVKIGIRDIIYPVPKDVVTKKGIIYKGLSEIKKVMDASGMYDTRREAKLKIISILPKSGPIRFAARIKVI
jgi:hypothetical protein